MPNVLLGNEIIIISVEDVRKLVNLFPSCSRIDVETLQQRGVLDVLGGLRDAVRRHDYERQERAEGGPGNA